MKNNTCCVGKQNRFYHIAVAGLTCAVILSPGPAHAQPLQINVVGPNGASVPAYRWLLEQDTTKPVTLDAAAVPGQNLSLSFHTSYAPVVASGDDASPAPNLNPTTRYFVSVLPDSGYTMGGSPVAPGQGTVTVTVNNEPVPTAQISVIAFNDNHPVNNTLDPPAEVGLEGFTVVVSEAGGRYGLSGGQVTQDAFGNPLGVIKTGPDGTALIKNLPPGKYGIQVVPPAGSDWHQTSTLEGTPTIDTWVKANEPAYLAEFGPAGHHAFFGFVNTLRDATLTGGGTITGRVVSLHMSRPPDTLAYNGPPAPNCWVGLNELAVVGGKGLYTTPCNPDSSFSIPGVPPGTYQLVIWDKYLDVIIAISNVAVPAGGGVVNLADVPVFNWYSHLESHVFFDTNSNGFRDPGEAGIPDQVVNLRFRDGTIYQSQSTGPNGFVAFKEIFPFSNWLIAEVDFARFKATGATVIVDAGGPIPADNGWTMPSRNKLNPQPQSENGGLPYRTETGPVLLQAFQGFIGQTNVIEWGKSLYSPGENGGITGIVRYATTRAENDPRFTAAENWEPGIPRVQVNLYEDFKNSAGDMIPDGIIDDLNGDFAVTLADVDNYPFGWRNGTAAKGNEDVDHNNNTLFDNGDAVAVTTTDSWDDSVPAGCQGEVFFSYGIPTDCFDDLRNFNQIRPGVFDGGYAFGSPLGEPDLAPGTYIVEAVAPTGYQHVKEEDKNVDFGDDYTPSLLALPPVCVGEPHTVKPELTLFPGVASEYANTPRPLCDRKQIVVAQGKNAAVDFSLFTEVPIAAHLVGVALDDTTAESNPNAPNFGEKYAPSFLPISIRDWTGREITRVYSDQWGKYNALVPSTFTVNAPMPSGVSPNMLAVCINSPGPILDTQPGSPTLGQYITDPHYNRQYSQFCYTLQYMPGTTTYADTPVIPTAAFAGQTQFPLDCELDNGTPVIYSVTGNGAGLNGPYVPTPTAALPQTITLVSVGTVSVANPAFDGTAATSKSVARNYGFGTTRGSVTLGNTTLPILTWSNGIITARVPIGASSGQLMVRRGDNGKRSVMGVTMTVGGTAPIIVPPGGSIQDAIDTAPAGALILVAPGNHDELVVMHKKIRLQGWGAPSTVINAIKSPVEKLQTWRDKVLSLYQAGAFDLLPGQTPVANPPPGSPTLFITEEGPGILVAANQAEFTATPTAEHARIDGFTISGADNGGGIMVNGYARYLEISNNRLINNSGNYGGGIRVGHPTLAPTYYVVDSDNDFIRIHNNHIAFNGGLAAGGGGVTLCTGATAYEVSANFICGNFTAGNGAGISHLGVSNNSRIANNTVVFNQSFNQGLGVSGGGLYIGGLTIPGGGLSAGSGSVSVQANLIQGNLAGVGDGGGIRAEFVNGQDVLASRANPANWYLLSLYNNIIVNNIAGMAGGGISLQDVVNADISHNTLSNNDSTATSRDAFLPGNPNRSIAQISGLVAWAHSNALFSAISPSAPVRFRKTFANPLLQNNIMWHNRSFYWRIDNTTTPSTFGLLPATPLYSDLGVAGTTGRLAPVSSVLTSTTGYATSNRSGNPLFVSEYFNGDRRLSIVAPNIISSMKTAGAFDEGGNFIDVRFGPLTLINPGTGRPFGDRHIKSGSAAQRAGVLLSTSALKTDFDSQNRPNPALSKPDAGADEIP